MSLSRHRARQIAVTKGPGAHILSPQKRPPKRKTTQRAVAFLDFDVKRRKLADHLASLLSTPLPGPSSTTACNIPVKEEPPDPNEPESQWVDVVEPEAGPSELPKTKPPYARRTAPNEATLKLYTKWSALLPSLIEPLLSYISTSTAKPLQAVSDCLQGVCQGGAGPCCERKKYTILCLYFDYFKSVTIEHCSCKHVADTLVRHGLFPTAPSQVRMAVSIDFLDFYGALFERSCDAVNAMAAALNTFYIRRGFYLLNSKKDRYREPFRRGLGYAGQWLDNLRALVDRHVDSLIEQADLHAHRLTEHTMDTTPSNPPPPLSLSTTSPATSIPSPSHAVRQGIMPSGQEPNQRTECARILRQLCPACFGGVRHGRPLKDGGDFQVATDGNFHHRHLTSGGESIAFHDPKHILPKEFVDAVGDLIRQARKTPPKKTRTPKVPDAAVDECQRSHEAADGEKKKNVSLEGRYDDMGWMSLVCRHDIPLFFANIDTPGEQQKYAIALIMWFHELIPPHATTTILYDIGCVLDRSIQIYDILPSQIHSRIQFVTTAMHAYGHQWSCQLIYNPRLCKGLGLTDGEGVERTWSRLRKLIPLVRVSSRARRIWLTDRQLSAIAYDLRADLGDWHNRRLRTGIKEQSKKAREVLEQCGVEASVLRAQWEIQKAAQLSIRAHAPARLKKELDTILILQADLESVEKAINNAKSMLTTSSAPDESKAILAKLYDMHETFTDKVESLYISLNIQDSYPDLKGASLDFVRTLLMACDLKINIRRKAIESFFEWDRLDQAVGGRSQALGTKLHQQTRKAISRRAPALVTSIRKFNAYCAKLHNMNNPTWNIPIPQPLPTKLVDLRDHSDLMEDVWISPSSTTPQPWLVNPNVRAGIRALIKLDRCVEEEHRLELEASNLCSWFGRELGAVEIALRTPAWSMYIIQFQQYRDQLLHLKSRWTNNSDPSLAAKFESCANEASLTASYLTGRSHIISNEAYIRNQVEDGSDTDGGESIDDDDADFQGNAVDVVDPIHDLPANEEAAEAIIMAEVSQMELNDDNNVDTSDWEHSEDNMCFQWPNQVGMLSADNQLVDFILQCAAFFNNNSPKHLASRLRTFDLGNEELQVLDKPDALLTDICINGMSSLLQAIIVRDPQHRASASQCTIFSTYDLVRINYKASDSELWRSTYRKEYWTKKVWIVPIHRQLEQHWVLAVFYLERKEVFLYDSLERGSAWKQNTQNLCIFLLRLVELAKRSGYGTVTVTTGWVARPVLIKPVQSNGHDCGLWVLVWIAAVLRGYVTAGTKVDESVMPSWRIALRNLLCLMSSSS